MSTTSTLAPPRSAPTESGPSLLWDTELLILRGEDRADLIERARALTRFLEQHPQTSLSDLAFSITTSLAEGGSRLALVAPSLVELRKRLERAIEKLTDPACEQIRDTIGIYYFARPLAQEGQVAFLFPGEGAQYPGMLGDVVTAFPEVAAFLAEMDARLAHIREGEPAVSELFLRRTEADEESLQRLDNAMLSVLLADGALHRVLSRLGLTPACAAGHSMGEMAALSACGAQEADEAFLERFALTMKILERQEAEGEEEFVLLAVGAGKATLANALNDSSVYLAMDNCPHQTVLVGKAEAMKAVQAQMQERGLVCERLSFRRPYHTPQFQPFLGPLRELFAHVRFQPPRIPVYSCTTAEPFPADAEAIRDLAIRHWAEPVRFTQMIEAMHSAGVRLFVEVGPRGNLSAFVEDILRGKRFAAVPANVLRRTGLTQLNHLVGQLAAHQVPLRLEEYYAPRQLRRIEYPAAPEPIQETNNEIADARTQVMYQYLSVMEQFLQVQQELTEAFLARRHDEITEPVSQDLMAATVPARAENLEAVPEEVEEAPGPLLGEVVRLVPGQEVVTRRALDLEEDRFALDHTVGGRQVSRVDPDQHGVPVMPMTFTLEILAEAAGLLAPGFVVKAIKKIRLLRWLAFDAEEPSLIEVSAKLSETTDTGEVQVTAEVRDLGSLHNPEAKGTRVAQGTVVLARTYPEAPQAEELPVANIRPVSMTVEQVYHNLFHGPMFQGVTRTLRGGDEGIEAEVQVLPRENLFRSTSSPRFRIDPVLLDVVLHPLATWHLHQPDLAGRIMLPVGLDSVEFFGPPAAEGTRFLSRAWVSEANLRSFSHRGETIAENGTVYIRLEGVKCWRFYVPFGEVNFHGPKDQYFLARRWSEVESQAASGTPPFALVRLEIPADLKQPAMSRVTAQVTLTPREWREIRQRMRGKEEVHDWLFERIAAKDAIRLLWHDRSGERLFPADIECELDEEGRYLACRREKQEERFHHAVVARAGEVTAALSSTVPVLGLALAELGEDSVEEVRARCIQDVLRKARVQEKASWLVHTAVIEGLVVAWTLGEKMP